MEKNVFLTVLEENSALARSLGQELANAGLNVSAHVMDTSASEDVLLKTLLPALVAELKKPGLGAWVIACSAQSIAQPLLRSFLSIALLAGYAANPKLAVLVSPATPLAQELPPLFHNAKIVKSALGARTVAAIAVAKAQAQEEWRLDVHALPQLGLWLEIGSTRDPWLGALLGACPLGDEALAPDAHGVGVQGLIPQRCTLNYPIEGIQLEFGGKRYTANSVMNELSVAQSYFVHLPNLPAGLLFGPYPQEEEPELYHLCLV